MCWAPKALLPLIIKGVFFVFFETLLIILEHISVCHVFFSLYWTGLCHSTHRLRFKVLPPRRLPAPSLAKTKSPRENMVSSNVFCHMRYQCAPTIGYFFFLAEDLITWLAFFLKFFQSWISRIIFVMGHSNHLEWSSIAQSSKLIIFYRELLQVTLKICVCKIWTKFQKQNWTKT